MAATGPIPLAGRRAYRRAVRHQLRGGCGEQRSPRRCGLGVRLRGDAAHRVRLCRAPASPVHRARAARHGRRRHGARCQRRIPMYESAAASASEAPPMHRLFTERAEEGGCPSRSLALPWRSPAIPRRSQRWSAGPAASQHSAVEADWEIASHGYRWIDYHTVPEAEEPRRPYRKAQFANRMHL